MPRQPTRRTLLRRTGLGLLILAILAGYVWLLRFGAQLAYPQWPRLQPNQQADLANKFQTLLIQAAGALGAGVAIWFTSRTYRLARRGQITDRFVKALEQLRSPEAYLRLGGVHALEQVLTDAPDHHSDIIEVLVAFIRRRAPRVPPRSASSRSPAKVPDQPEPELPPEPAPDVQAALTALGRRPNRLERTRLALHGLHLRRAVLNGAHLAGATLNDADLTGAYLDKADLTDVYLQEADLTGAYLDRADLSHAHLEVANLTGAHLSEANLTRANLGGADLAGANLDRANLTNAYLDRANLTNANLGGADLAGAYFYRANLTSANLDGAILERANLTGAWVSAGVTLPGWKRDPATRRLVRASRIRDNTPGQEAAAPDSQA